MQLQVDFLISFLVPPEKLFGTAWLLNPTTMFISKRTTMTSPCAPASDATLGPQVDT